MRLFVIAVILTIVVSASAVKTRNHEFIDMFTKDPGMMLDLASGDYLTLLPDFIEPHVRKLLGKEKKTGVAGFLDTAQGLLGGKGSSPLDSLMGGQSPGSGFSNVLSGLTGGSSSGGSSSGGLGALSGLLGGFGKQEQQQSSGGITSMFSNLFHERQRMNLEHKGVKHLRAHKH